MKVNIWISYLSWSSDPHIRHLLGKLVISISYWSKFFFPNFIWSSSVICSLVSPLPYSKHIIDTFFHPQCKLADSIGLIWVMVKNVHRKISESCTAVCAWANALSALLCQHILPIYIRHTFLNFRVLRTQDRFQTSNVLQHLEKEQLFSFFHQAEIIPFFEISSMLQM